MGILSLGHFLSFDFSLSSRIRFNSFPINKTRWPIIPKVLGYLSSRLPMDISCPVSRNFPHGTLHYQSRQFFSSLVGGSTFFNPYFMYKFTRNSRQFSCTGCVHLPLASVSLCNWKVTLSLPFELFSLPHSTQSYPFRHSKSYQFRSPLLSVSLLISLHWY
jgi:hypothetical protein